MKLLNNALLFAGYVMLMLALGFVIATMWLDNPGTVYVFAIAWFILVIGSGLGLMGKR